MQAEKDEQAEDGAKAEEEAQEGEAEAAEVESVSGSGTSTGSGQAMTSRRTDHACLWPHKT